MNKESVNNFIEYQIKSLNLFKRRYVFVVEIFFIPAIIILCYILGIHIVSYITFAINVLAICSSIYCCFKKYSKQAKMMAMGIMSTDIAFAGLAGAYMFIYSSYNIGLFYYFILLGIYILCNLFSLYFVIKRSKNAELYSNKETRPIIIYSSFGFLLGSLLTRYALRNFNYDTNLIIGSCVFIAITMFSSQGVGFYYVYYLMRSLNIK